MTENNTILSYESKYEAYKTLCMLFLKRVKYCIDSNTYNKLSTLDFDKEDERSQIEHDIGDINYYGGKYKGFEAGLVIHEFITLKLDENPDVDRELKIYAVNKFTRLFYFKCDIKNILNSFIE